MKGEHVYITSCRNRHEVIISPEIYHPSPYITFKIIPHFQVTKSPANGEVPIIY
jgi:hypothetical protein